MRRNIDVTKGPSREQLAMLERAAAMPVPAGAEYPELSEDELLQFTKISDEQGQKHTVTLQLSPQALEKARSLGKGYTAVLSRILERALDDPNIVRSSL